MEKSERESDIEENREEQKKNMKGCEGENRLKILS